MEPTPPPETIEVMPWHAQFATGFADIDAQHRRLVAEINQLALGLAATDTKPFPAASLARLLDYAAVQFDTEERLWARWLGADPRVEAHRRRHARFIETIHRLGDQATGAPATRTALDLLGFLTRWLAQHILREDHRLARLIRARQAGQTLAEPPAKHATEPPAGNLTGEAAPGGAASGPEEDQKAAADPQAALVDNLLALYELLADRTFDLLRETHLRRHREEALRLSHEQERSLRRQRDTRQLINDLAADFMAASSGDFDPAVARILQRGGEHFAADRAYVFLFDAEERTLSNTHEWCAPAIEPQIDLLQHIPSDQVAWWWEQIAQVGQVLIPDVAELPASATTERALLEPQGIQSLCAFPLFQADQLSGFVGFDSVLVRREWSEGGILDFSHGISDLISIARARSQMQQTLTAAREAEARHASELRLGILVDQGLAGVAEVDLQGRLTRVNDRYCQMHRPGAGGTPGSPSARFHLPRGLGAGGGPLRPGPGRGSGGHRGEALSGPCRSSRQAYARIAVSLMRGQGGEPSGFLTLVTDTTEFKQTQERLRALTDVAHDAILMMNPQGAITYSNPAATEILGYRAEEALGRDLHRLLAPERFQAAHRQAFTGFRDSGQGAAINKTVELAASRKDGREIVIELSLAAIALQDGWNSVGILRDITARKQAEVELRHSEQRYRQLTAELERRVQERTAELSAANRELTRLAITDALTGICNRRHFQETLAVEIARARRYGNPLSLVMFDIDHSKAINDRHGHQAGDRVLIEVAARARDNLRVSDHLARWGGEEFMIMLPQGDQGAARYLAEKLRSLIAATPFGEIGQVTSSFGVTEFDPRETEDACLQRLDAALYAAKAAGRNRVKLGEHVRGPDHQTATPSTRSFEPGATP